MKRLFAVLYRRGANESLIFSNRERAKGYVDELVGGMARACATGCCAEVVEIKMDTKPTIRRVAHMPRTSTRRRAGKGEA